jgi:HEAT repeat protein
LPADYTNDVAHARMMAVRQEGFLRTERSNHRRFLGANGPDDTSLSDEQEKAVQGMMKSLYPEPDELPPYFKVTSADLPECSGLIPSLASNAWWLTKQTWTFQPEEMRDLNFEPAMPAFASLLSSQYGYFANAGLAAFGSNAIPTIIEAMQNSNPAVRVTASGIFYGEYGSDWRYGYWNNEISLGDGRFITPALSWLKDPEPEVRKAGVAELALGNWNPEFSPSIIALLRDKNPDVRRFVIALLGSVRYANDLMGYIPQFMQMLKDSDPNTREAGLQILQHMNVQIPREDLLAFFKSSDYRTLDAAWAQLQNQGEKLSDNDILPLLQNPNPVAHLLALSTLGQNPGKQSVELALPLLEDPSEFVRLSANRTLCSLTGQEFSADEPDKWIQWWDANKAHFMAQNPGQ